MELVCDAGDGDADDETVESNEEDGEEEACYDDEYLACWRIGWLGGSFLRALFLEVHCRGYGLLGVRLLKTGRETGVALEWAVLGASQRFSEEANATCVGEKGKWKRSWVDDAESSSLPHLIPTWFV